MTLLSCRQYTQIISNDDVTVHTYLWCCQVCCGRRPSLCATRRRKRSAARRATSTRSPSSSTRSTARTDRSATRTSPPKVCTQHAPHRQRYVRNTLLIVKGLYASCTSAPKVCTSLHLTAKGLYARCGCWYISVNGLYARAIAGSRRLLWSDLISAQFFVVYDVSWPLTVFRNPLGMTKMQHILALFGFQRKKSW